MFQYTCPMHPEITSDKPGVCPKCGMQLAEKSKVSGANKMKIMHPKMMDGMSDASHKKGFPKMLLMGALMGVAAIIMMVSRH